MNIAHKSIIKLNDNSFFDLLAKELLKYGAVKVTGLGVFRLKKMKEHTRYIPGSQKVGKVKARVKLTFTPTKQLKITIQSYGKKGTK